MSGVNQLKTGHFYGELTDKVSFDGITVTDAIYTHDYVDWHCHENPYFTFLLNGKLIEENKKESYTLTQGSLLFHNWDDAHRNIKPPEYTRGAHIEINQSWIEAVDLNLDSLEGSLNIENPMAKNTVVKILLESKQADHYNKASIEMALVDLFSHLKADRNRDFKKRPIWFERLKELVYFDEGDQPITLAEISKVLQLHPVYLSREFHKYYGQTFGQFCRAIRLHKAINGILSSNMKLADIAYLVHYYDQSHMVGDFKKNLNVSPKLLKSILG